MTFASPLKIFVRLDTIISANAATSTLMKFPIVSSTTMMKPNSSASFLSSTRSGERSSGLLGNSQNSDRIRPSSGRLFSNNARRLGMSSDPPEPKNSAPAPHFLRIFSVSVYGNLSSACVQRYATSHSPVAHAFAFPLACRLAVFAANVVCVPDRAHPAWIEVDVVL